MGPSLSGLADLAEATRDALSSGAALHSSQACQTILAAFKKSDDDDGDCGAAEQLLSRAVAAALERLTAPAAAAADPRHLSALGSVSTLQLLAEAEEADDCFLDRVAGALLRVPGGCAALSAAAAAALAACCCDSGGGKPDTEADVAAIVLDGIVDFLGRLCSLENYDAEDQARAISIGLSCSRAGIHAAAASSEPCSWCA